jgi:hypothetical protein
MFKSLPLTIRKIEATEARLNRIYDAAKLGLKGDTLALASGMRPEEFRQLCELDPLAMMAVQKGKADGEMEMSQVLHQAAREGDAKAALEILKHQHDWTAKQAVSVEVNQTISIISALQEAENRVINMGIIDEAPASGNSTGLLTNDEGASNGYPDFNRRASADASKLRR